ncbi:MAG: zinc ribbon domain-containing protein [Nannocystis sp.]|nr:zinc ribbon domain-containing protein [Nannocystis sp.]MBA3547912.1 zinc ribbon domain-containing protein [Nannocystis sp.]
MSETGTTPGTAGTPGTPAGTSDMTDTKRRILLLAGGALGAALVVLALLVTVFGARLDAPTIALAAAAAALVYALGQLYAMVWALSRPDRVAQVGQAAGSFTQAELRDEKRRLLRAIKELEFDFGMGKLSQIDHDTVIATYRLRAIEVMRALEGGSSLHPELARVLAERDSAATPPASSASAPASSATSTAEHDVAAAEVEPVPGPAASGPFDQTTRICGICGGTNDPDARFCKSCGAPMKKPDLSTTQRPAQPARSGEIGGGAS